MHWSEQGDAELRELWMAGETARAIAKKMGCSHNSVTSRAHKLRLPKRVNPVPQSSKPKAKSKSEVLQTHNDQRWRPLIGFRLATGARYERCQYIAGDPLAGAEKCGAPALEDSAYCAEHYELCHQPRTIEEALRHDQLLCTLHNRRQR